MKSIKEVASTDLEFGNLLARIVSLKEKDSKIQSILGLLKLAISPERVQKINFISIDESVLSIFVGNALLQTFLNSRKRNMLLKIQESYNEIIDIKVINSPN
ncbi:MAG: hypothetical protein R3Y52_03690 [Psittacicella sp.]